MSTGTATRHILAIDDDNEIRSLVRDVLEDEGYRVSTRPAVDKDLGAIIATAPDLIILDYRWANEDGGWSLLQLLRMDPRTAHLPVVLCTGAVKHVAALRSRLADMRVAVVFKPFDITQLTTTIAELFTVEATPGDGFPRRENGPMAEATTAHVLAAIGDAVALPAM